MKKYLGLLMLPMLSACGGEKYEVPVTTAYQTLTSVGTPTALAPITGAMGVVSNFQATPDDSRVEWKFTKEGKDVGRIIAKATASGDAASKIQLWYEEGSAADEGAISKARPLVRDKLKRVLWEAVDSRMDNRPADAALVQQIQIEVTASYAGEMMKQANSGFDAAIAEHRKDQMDTAYRQQSSTAAATQPSMNLSGY
ncbi:hypothetical protein GCM10022211_06220 [Sphingomonas humi]|uniref:Lipoprotein n=2 Tax=Sphingomonas humi TaxID=335630 RepID=A0ABP7RM58_9SPHN